MLSEPDYERLSLSDRIAWHNNQARLYRDVRLRYKGRYVLAKRHEQTARRMVWGGCSIRSSQEVLTAMSLHERSSAPAMAEELAHLRAPDPRIAAGWTKPPVAQQVDADQKPEGE
jgi:hypothetical protein